VAEAHSPRPHGAAETKSALSEKAQAFQSLAKEAFSEFSPEVGASLDLVQVTVAPDKLVPLCRKAKEDPRLDFKLILLLTAVDYKDRFQIVYHLQSLSHEWTLVVKTDLPYDNPRVPSVSSVWRGADWYEREMHELFGIVFEGHPNLVPLLLWEGFEGYPGRKSYPFYDYQEW